jgi:hypothetical protein
VKWKNIKDADLTAYCGLYCGDCPRYQSRTLGMAKTLIDDLRDMRFGEYVEVKKDFLKEFERYDEFLKVLSSIAILRCSTPCRVGGDGCLGPCPIKSCVQAKKLDGCWQCDEMDDCKQFKFLDPFSGDIPKENLRKVRKYGLDDWAKYRGKFYRWL